jgi:4'-phosphopantetheinyl transferase
MVSKLYKFVNKASLGGINDSSWLPPPGTLSLKEDEVHVFLANLRGMISQVENYKLIISGDERKRAGRLYFQEDHDFFVVSKGLFRVILGRYLNREPQKLRLLFGPYGKPYLDPDEDGELLRFNTSHSNGVYLVALTRGREVGADVEHMRFDLSFDHIIDRFFTEGEKAALRILSPDARRRAFFSCWTRKEAFLKATGKGLSLSLNQFEVTISPEEPPRLLSIKKNSQEASRWSLQDIDVGSNYSAALAVKGHNWKLRLWEWKD